MKIAAVVCNVALFLFTVVVLVTDGFSSEIAYNALAFLLLLMPLLTVAVVLRTGPGGAGAAVRLSWAALAGNLLLAASVVWAIVAQWPHSEEADVAAFSLLAAGTPVLSAVALSRQLQRPRPA